MGQIKNQKHPLGSIFLIKTKISYLSTNSNDFPSKWNQMKLKVNSFIILVRVYKDSFFKFRSDFNYLINISLVRFPFRGISYINWWRIIRFRFFLGLFILVLDIGPLFGSFNLLLIYYPPGSKSEALQLGVHLIHLHFIMI